MDFINYQLNVLLDLGECWISYDRSTGFFLTLLLCRFRSKCDVCTWCIFSDIEMLQIIVRWHGSWLINRNIAASHGWLTLWTLDEVIVHPTWLTLVQKKGFRGEKYQRRPSSSEFVFKFYFFEEWKIPNLFVKTRAHVYYVYAKFHSIIRLHVAYRKKTNTHF
jgi:hypothetical protein